MSTLWTLRLVSTLGLGAQVEVQEEHTHTTNAKRRNVFEEGARRDAALL